MRVKQESTSNQSENIDQFRARFVRRVTSPSSFESEACAG